MEQAAARNNELSFHPVCSIFPLMPEEQLAALAADIREHGLREPIVVAGNAILDGRNRWLACQKSAREPWTVEWDRHGSLLDFVLSVNLHRRHLSTSQRAMVAGRIATMKSGERTDLQSNDIRSSPGTISVDGAAVLMAVSKPSVFRAKAVLEGGTPDEIHAVEEGRATVNSIVRKVWARNRDQKRQQTAEVIALPVLPRSHGPAPKLPEGMTRSQLAASAVELRETLGSAEAVASVLKIDRKVCGQLIDIMMIGRRRDLGPRDTLLAERALAHLDDVHVPLSSLCEMLAPIADRLWGKGRKGKISRAGLEANRAERFERGFGILLQACRNGSKIEIPHMAPAKAKEVLAELREAVSHVRELMEKIERSSK